MYTREDPKWVQASHVEAAVPDGSYVNVTAYGEEFKMRRVGWSNPQMDKTKSDVLVENKQGDWLKVWFLDADVVPFKDKQTAESDST